MARGIPELEGRGSRSGSRQIHFQFGDEKSVEPGLIQIVFLGQVEGDLNAGRNFYEEQELGVGEYFVNSILADVDSLILFAGVHRKQFGFHRILGRTFPFAIYYCTTEDEVVVCAILDMRSKPTWLRSGLGART